MRLTIRLKLPNAAKTQALAGYQTEFTRCVAWWLQRCREAGMASRKGLHRGCYAQAKGEFPGLLTLSLASAMDKAREAYRAWRRRGGAFPTNGSMACFKAPQYRFAGDVLILHLKGYTLKLPFHIAPRHRAYLGLKHGRADLVRANGYWYFHVPVEVPPAPTFQPQGVIGIDLGLAKLAALSNGVFFRGEQTRFIRNHYSQKRTELQGKLKAHPKAYRVLKRLSGKESRWVRDQNHKISRAIVNSAREAKAAIAMENLEGIRGRIRAPKKVRRMLNSWSFRQLRFFLEYKSQLAGVPNVSVDPRHTSTRCSRCGHEEKGNRKRQAEFLCRSCGYHLNADLNAARNIAQLGSLLLGHIPERTGGPASAPMGA